MNIERIYLQKIAEKVLLEMLDDGVVPTASAILESVEEKSAGLNLGQPVTTQPAPVFQRLEESSATKINQITGVVVDDLDAIYDALLVVERTSLEITSRVYLELQQIEKDIRSLIDRADDLLLSSENTEGLLNSVGDDFQDLGKVNLAETTAFIDTTAHVAHGNFFSEVDGLKAGEMSLAILAESDVTFSILNPTASRSPGLRDSRARDMLVNSLNPTLFSLFTPTIEPTVAIEIKIDLRKLATGSPVEINRLLFDPFLYNNSISVFPQYSLDGISWRDLPVADPVRRIGGPTLYIFERIELSFLRLVLSKDTPDNPAGEGGEYNFGVRHIGLYGYRSVFQEESHLVSRSLHPIDGTGAPQSFSKVSLGKVCDHIETDTSIDYFLAFSMPGDVTTDFYPVLPVGSKIPGPQVLTVADVSSIQTQTEITDEEIEFPFSFLEETRVLDLELDSAENIKVWRNKGFRDRFYRVLNNDGQVVESGWERKEDFYYTTGLVTERSGMSIDFGPSPVEVDGQTITGAIRLGPGPHSFKVAAQNWYSLEGLAQVRSLDPARRLFTGVKRMNGSTGLEEALDAYNETPAYSVIDPLYPFNHKLLIEGLDYSTVYGQEKIYSGIARYAATLLKEGAEMDVATKDAPSDRTRYAVSRESGSDKKRILVKWLPFGSESPREIFVIDQKAGTFAEGVVFKAVFKTKDPKKTPSLEGYSIRIS